MLYIFLIINALTFLGCRRTPDSPSDTIIMGVPAAPQTIDPRYALDAFGQNLRALLFTHIVKLTNTGPNNSLAPAPELATSWTVHKNIFSFELKKDAKFSDGSPITREDIEFSIRTFQHPANPFSQAFRKIKKIEFFEKPKNLQMVLTTERYESTFFLDIALLPILPKHIVEKMGDNYYENLVSSGTYKLVSANESSILLEANPYSFEKPKTKKVLFKIIRDDNTRFLRMFKGDLDIVVNDMPSTKIIVFEHSPDFKVITTPGANITYLVLNLKDPLLKELSVREAIVRAINKQEIIDYKLEGLAIPANTFVLPDSAYFSLDIHLDEYAPQKARETFLSLPKPVELEIKTSNQRSAVENGKTLAYQLKQAGVNVSLKSYEWGTFYADIKKGNFQIATMKAVGVQDPDLYRLMFHSTQTPPTGLNRGYYNNPELDKLLQKGNQIEQLPERIEYYKKIQKIVVNDLPMIPLWYDKYVAIINKRIKGFTPTPQTGFSFLLQLEKSHDSSK
ncbi:MAG: ABC transporter substrate-binding protein [Bdellovibrionaceae bacterium]|nr:ABC transporter substrate-binding protein [Pseudobdellovibrionaceae bacterium]